MRFPDYYYDSRYSRMSLLFGVLALLLGAVLTMRNSIYLPLGLVFTIPLLTSLLALLMNVAMPGRDDVAIARVWSAMGQVVALFLLPTAFAIVTKAAVAQFFGAH